MPFQQHECEYQYGPFETIFVHHLGETNEKGKCIRRAGGMLGDKYYCPVHMATITVDGQGDYGFTADYYCMSEQHACEYLAPCARRAVGKIEDKYYCWEHMEIIFAEIFAEQGER